jgi:hypothetical protein
MDDSDMIGDIPRGPKAAELMEFHLFSRLSVDPMDNTEPGPK